MSFMIVNWSLRSFLYFSREEPSLNNASSNSLSVLKELTLFISSIADNISESGVVKPFF